MITINSLLYLSFLAHKKIKAHVLNGKISAFLYSISKKDPIDASLIEFKGFKNAFYTIS